MNKRECGAYYEERVIRYLESKDIEILEHNYRNRYGEIDIIGLDKDVLVFIEVKYRRTRLTGTPDEAVDWKKQKQICKISRWYLAKNSSYFRRSIRYDVIAVYGEKDCERVKWIKNAFPFIGSS